MKISLNWLQQWLDTPEPLQCDELCQALTFSGLEVEAAIQQGLNDAKIIVGQIKQCGRHPQADSLHLCQVDSGSDLLQIVCGAHNVRAGMKVALALPGARIEGKKLKKSKLRGVESQGMMCSSRELGLGDDHSGIVELPEQASVGSALSTCLNTSDYLIDVGITPNRGDCLSLLGIARDLAASQADWSLRPLEFEPVKVAHEATLPVKLSAPEACPKFCGCIIKQVDLRRPSPQWLRERLEKAGMRSIDAAVDITNYVMLELGQPMHAYDLRQIAAGGIEVRFASAGEKLMMIDNSEQQLDERDLLITDGEKILGLGGVMGGKYSGISANTKDIYLEAAWFNPEVVHGQARRRGLNSEAAHRFERFVDFANTETAMQRAIGLFVAITGGVAGKLLTTANTGHLPPQPSIKMNLQRAQKLLGLEIGSSDLRADNIEDYLRALGCEVEVGAEWRVQPPSYRPDLRIEADLLEEIARIHGYDKIPEKLPQASPNLTADYQAAIAAERVTLAQLGYQENINFSFVSADKEQWTRPSWAIEPIQLQNPLGQEFSTMRSSLVVGLLSSAQANLKRQREWVKAFECGRVFWRNEDNQYTERDHIAGLCVCADLFPDDWQGSANKYGFYDMKAEVETLAPVQWRAIDSQQQFLHPGQSASLVGSDGEVVGFCGLLHPQMQARFDLPAGQQVWLFELRSSALAQRHWHSYRELSDQPESYRDLALLVPQALSYSQLQAGIEAAAGKYLKRLTVFDRYQGQQVQAGYYSLALRLSWQHPDKSLSLEQINQYQEKIVAALRQLEVKLRA